MGRTLFEDSIVFFTRCSFAAPVVVTCRVVVQNPLGRLSPHHFIFCFGSLWKWHIYWICLGRCGLLSYSSTLSDASCAKKNMGCYAKLVVTMRSAVLIVSPSCFQVKHTVSLSRVSTFQSEVTFIVGSIPIALVHVLRPVQSLTNHARPAIGGVSAKISVHLLPTY